MMASNLHDDLHRQPPAFSGSTPKRPCRESLSDALSGAAVSFAKAFNGEQPNTCTSSSGPPHSCLSSSTSLGVSSGKEVELRMKNNEQLCYLQQLFDDGILSQQDKNGILLELSVNFSVNCLIVKVWNFVQICLKSVNVGRSHNSTDIQ